MARGTRKHPGRDRSARDTRAGTPARRQADPQAQTALGGMIINGAASAAPRSKDTPRYFRWLPWGSQGASRGFRTAVLATSTPDDADAALRPFFRGSEAAAAMLRRGVSWMRRLSGLVGFSAGSSIRPGGSPLSEVAGTFGPNASLVGSNQAAIRQHAVGSPSFSVCHCTRGEYGLRSGQTTLPVYPARNLLPTSVRASCERAATR
jgi:hypothetical protein